MTTALTDETVHNGREKNGRFGRGNTFATGNPFARRVAHFRQIIADSISDSDISKVIETLVTNAKLGDIAATKLLLSYTVGQPQAFENPDHVIYPDYLLNVFETEIKREIEKQLFDLQHWNALPIKERILKVEQKLVEIFGTKEDAII